MPKVSIVTPSYNHVAFAAERVESILGQSFTDWEWLIIDDASTDGSPDVLERLTSQHPRVRVLVNESNQGMGGTVEKAIALTDGHYVHRAESDDVCHPRFLERMVEWCDAHPSVGLAHCRTLRMDELGRTSGGYRQPRHNSVTAPHPAFTRLVMGNHIAGSSVLFTRAAYEAVGGFAVRPFSVCCDWHFALRISVNFPIGYVGSPLAMHRTHGNNLSGRVGRMLDVQLFATESYELLADVFSRIPADSGLAELRPRAVRALSLGHGVSFYRTACEQRRFDIAEDIKQAIESADPGAIHGWSWRIACARQAANKLIVERMRRVAESVGRRLVAGPPTWRRPQSAHRPFCACSDCWGRGSSPCGRAQ